MNLKLAVIFDMDGVLVDNYTFHQEAWNRFLKQYKIELPGDFRSGIFGGTNKEHLETIFRKTLQAEDIARYEQQKEKIYRDLYAPEIKPVQGLLPFIESLKGEDIPIALATSSPPVNVDFVLKNIGLINSFGVILNSSNVTRGKPNPEIYIKTGAQLNVPSSRCIVIEDSRNGIIAAKNAGMKVIGITTTHPASELPEVDLMIENFDQLNVPMLKNLI